MSQQECFAPDQANNGRAAPPELPQQIEAQIQGEISGQVTVGSNVVQLGSVHGGVVHINSSADKPIAKPRALPVLLRPRPFLNLIGREQEVAAIIALLKGATPTEICGLEGIGKTSLLRYLSHRPEFSLLFPDGVVYLSARSKPVSDLLQSLYDAFYDYGAAVKPTAAQISHDLQDKRALIVLDDIQLTRDDLEEMMDIVSGSTFLFSSPEQLLWSEGESIVLAGLASHKAIALIENKLGRSLLLEEKAAAETLCQLLQGHPLKLLQCLGQVKQKLKTLDEIVRQHRSNACDLDAYTKSERQILSVLSTVGQAGLQAQQITEIAALPDAATVLHGLHQRDTVQLEGDRYSLKASEAALLESKWNLHPHFSKVLAYFIQFAKQHRTEPERIHREAEALLKLLQKAAEAGLWSEVLSLGQSIENAFAIKKQWGAWETILKLGLRAARETGQKASEALMLHQIGTRAVCIGEQEIAQQALSQAVEIRESLGDRTGAAISRHNLQILLFIIATATTAAAAAVIITANSASAGMGSAAVGTAGAAGVTAAGTATTGTGLVPWLIGGAGAALLTTGVAVGQQTFFRPQVSRDAIGTPLVKSQNSDLTPRQFEGMGESLTPPVGRFQSGESASAEMTEDADTEDADTELDEPIADESSPETPTPESSETPRTQQILQEPNPAPKRTRPPTPPPPAVTPPPDEPTTPEPRPSPRPDNEGATESDRSSNSRQPSSSVGSVYIPPPPPMQEPPPVLPAVAATSEPTINQEESPDKSEMDTFLGTQFGNLHDARNYLREQRGE